MTDARDLWIVQLDDLIKHALKIRDDNVMKYRRNVKKAFEMGINMLVLLEMQVFFHSMSPKI